MQEEFTPYARDHGRSPAASPWFEDGDHVLCSARVLSVVRIICCTMHRLIEALGDLLALTRRWALIIAYEDIDSGPIQMRRVAFK